MGFGSWIRRAGYWTMDALVQHGEVRGYYTETKDGWEHGTDPADTERKLQALLEHAAATTKFYEGYKDKHELKDFPLVNKIDYQSRWDDFVSSKYANDKHCHMDCTSGSTGTPLEILYDPSKLKRRYGASIFLNTLANYQIGDRQVYLRIWVDRVKKSFLEQKMTNLIPWDTTNLDDGTLRELCETIRKRHVKQLAGYASSITQLSEFIERAEIDVSGYGVRSITPGSEMTLPYIRKQLEEQFGCAVNCIYGTEEFGTIGVQLTGRDEYYIDTTGVIPEVIKMDSDEPAEDGELGRLVITDLHNYGFPLIRYENGDTVVRRTEAMPGGRYKLYFTQIYGRKIDVVYDTKGEPLSPYLLVNKMWGIEHVTQWKFIQLDRDKYRFQINGDKDKIDEGYITGLFKDDLGEGAVISFEYVDEIPVLRSGKRRFIENRYRKGQSNEQRDRDKA